MKPDGKTNAAHIICDYCGHGIMRHHDFIILGDDEPTFCRNKDCTCEMYDEGDVTLRDDLNRILTKKVIFVIQEDEKQKRGAMNSKYNNGWHDKVLDELELAIARYYKHNYKTERKSVTR